MSYINFADRYPCWDARILEVNFVMVL